MPDVKAIEEAVQALPPANLAAFRRWFVEFDAGVRDSQTESDALAGRLDVWLAKAEADRGKPPTRAL
jgi:hypothetical protein